MVKVSILYPAAAGRFDVDYYLSTHMPMSIARLGPAMRRIEVEIGVSGALPDQPPTHVAMCHFVCDTAEAFLAAFLPHAAELQADMINYTDMEPIIQVSEIRIAHPAA
jgi:uncharacterized protein (TIGR02118 family)